MIEEEDEVLAMVMDDTALGLTAWRTALRRELRAFWRNSTSARQSAAPITWRWKMWACGKWIGATASQRSSSVRVTVNFDGSGADIIWNLGGLP